jgi:hypothetical protein
MSKNNDFQSFIFGETIYKQIQELPQELQLKFFKACCDYGLYNIEPEFNGLEKALWLSMQNLIKIFKDKRGINRDNGSKKGKSKSETERTKANESETERTKANESEPKANVNVNVNDNVNIKNLLTSNEVNNQKRTNFLKSDFSFIIFEDKTLQSQWKDLVKEWLVYKKEIYDSYKSSKSISAFYQKLYSMSGGELSIAREIVGNSIANGYKGIFELKKSNYSPNKTPESRGEQNKKNIMNAFPEVFKDMMNSAEIVNATTGASKNQQFQNKPLKLSDTAEEDGEIIIQQHLVDLKKGQINGNFDVRNNGGIEKC